MDKNASRELQKMIAKWKKTKKKSYITDALPVEIWIIVGLNWKDGTGVVHSLAGGNTDDDHSSRRRRCVLLHMNHGHFLN